MYSRAFSCFLNNKRAEDDSAAFKAAAQLYGDAKDNVNGRIIYETEISLFSHSGICYEHSRMG